MQTNEPINGWADGALALPPDRSTQPASDGVNARSAIMARHVAEAINSSSTLRAAIAGVNSDLMLLEARLYQGISETLGPDASISPAELEMYEKALNMVARLSKQSAQYFQLELKIMSAQGGGREH